MIAGFVQGVIGFGFGMLAMSVIPFYVDIAVAVPIVAVFGTTMNTYLMWGLRPHLDLRKIGPMVVGGALGAPIGVFLLRSADPQYMKLALGIILLMYCAYALFGSGGEAKERRGLNPWWGAAFGSVGGLLQGGLNTGGPPVVVYATLQPWGKHAMKATLVTFFWAIGVAQIVYFLSSGMLAGDAAVSTMALLPVMFVGTFVGVRIYDRIPHDRFRIAVLLFLTAMGVNFVVRSV